MKAIFVLKGWWRTSLKRAVYSPCVKQSDTQPA
ncbi:trp operon leader peptide [Escherichia coli]|nr:trp operon leader peptide [Escherichia coli]